MDTISLDQAIKSLPQIQADIRELKALMQDLIKKEVTPNLLTLDEAAKVLGIARTTLLNWVSQRKITVVKAGGNKFDPEDLAAFIRKNRIRGRRKRRQWRQDGVAHHKRTGRGAGRG